MLPWQEIGAALVALAGGIFGTHHYKEWQGRRNGHPNSGHVWIQKEATAKVEMVLAALERIDDSIKTGSRDTRQLIKDHQAASEKAILMFQQSIAVMKQDCAVSHATLLTTLKSEKPT